MSEPTLQPAELPKRFYTDATVSAADGAWRVLLDGRVVRTPGRAILEFAQEPLALAIAAEWAAQGERINPASMPLTRLANTAIDGVGPRLAETRDDLLRYIETDLLFYRAEGPERLVETQSCLWDPVVAWAAGRVGGRFAVTSGIMHVAQPAESIQAFGQIIATVQDPLQLAALHQITTLSGSALLALAVLEGQFGAAEAFRRAHIDEDWNTSLWGEDAEAAARRAARLADMEAAGRLLALLAGQMPANHS